MLARPCLRHARFTSQITLVLVVLAGSAFGLYGSGLFPDEREGASATPADRRHHVRHQPDNIVNSRQINAGGVLKMSGGWQIYRGSISDTTAHRPVHDVFYEPRARTRLRRDSLSVCIYLAFDFLKCLGLLYDHGRPLWT